MKIQVKSDHYINNYDEKVRFCSYWHQIHEILHLNSSEVLEIGQGNGFVSSYLKKKNVNIVTLDIDKELNPSFVGEVQNMPFEDNSYETVACYEVLEHIPYDQAILGFSEIARVAKKNVVISMPDSTQVCRIHFHIPKIIEIKKIIRLPRIKKRFLEFDGQHYWEIGKVNYPLNRIVNDIQKCGLTLIKTYRVYEHPYHRFFVFQKKSL